MYSNAYDVAVDFTFRSHIVTPTLQHHGVGLLSGLMSYIGVASGCSVGCAECLMERCFVKVYKVEQQVGICRSVTAKLLNVTHALEDLRSGSGACSTEGCTSISSTSPSAVRSIIR